MAALLLPCLACGPGAGPERNSESPVTPLLSFDSDLESATYGKVLLGPLSADHIQRLAANGDSLPPLLSIWTGETKLEQGSCTHPQAQPSMLGEVRVSDQHLIFEPRFPLVPDLSYTACADLEALAELLPARRPVVAESPVTQLHFRLALPASSTAPEVSEVWPGSQPVPANLLRLYVHFSEPMQRREVASKVDLLDQEGKVIPDAFVEIPEGLWDPAGQRLTLFLHPGRIKRGVGPNQGMGPVLRSQESVRLRIDAAMQSRRGVALGQPFELSLQVADADRKSPQPGLWRLEPPLAPEQPIVVHFDEALDRAQLARFARIVDTQGRTVEGTANVDGEGRWWSFLPRENWPEGNYRWLGRRDIEDLAGNTPDRLFDVQTEPNSPASSTAQHPGPSKQSGALEIRFEVRFAAEGPNQKATEGRQSATDGRNP